MAAIVGILLAAGVGKRFDSSGRCFKLVQAIDCENTVIERSACNLRQHCDQMIIVHGPRSAESWQATQHLDALQLSCTQAHLGMGASLKCAIAAMPPPSAGWILALADMPYIKPQSYQQLVEALKGNGLLARPLFQQRPGHPVAFHRDLADDLLQLPDNLGAQPLFQRYREQALWINSEDAGTVMDIDVPSDLR